MQIKGSILFCAILMAGCATSAPAGKQGATPASITVMPWRNAGPVTAALKKSKRLQVKTVQPAPKLQRAGEDAGAGQRGEAEERAASAIADAPGLYRKMEFKQAVALLGGARQALTQVADGKKHFQSLQQLSFLLGINHLALKEEAPARAAITEALLLGYKGPEPGAYPPQVEAFIRSEQAALEGAAKGTISAITKPAGATVLVDGVERGRTPLTVEVAPGLHYLRFFLPCHEPRVLRQQVASGRVESAEVFLKPSSGAVLARQLLIRHETGAPLPGRIPGLAGLLGADRALVVVRGKVERRTARLLWTGNAAAQGDGAPCQGAAPEALARCLEPRLYRLAGGDTAGDASATATATPLYKRWWFWTVVAGGAAALAGGAVGIYYGTRGNPGTDLYLE